MGRVNSGLAMWMAHLKLSGNFFFGDFPTRQEVGQERGDIGSTQQGNLFLMLPPFYQQKPFSGKLLR